MPPVIAAATTVTMPGPVTLSDRPSPTARQADGADVARAPSPAAARPRRRRPGGQPP